MWSKVLALCALLTLWGHPAFAESTIWKVEALTGKWTYSLGSSPRLQDGAWLWAQPDFDATGWQQPARAGQTPLRHGDTELWARIRMPGPGLSSPMLYLRVLGDLPDVYLQGRLLPLEQIPRHAWDEHHKFGRRLLIPLPPDYAGQVLSIHLRSSDSQIGIQAPAYLGEPTAVALTLLRDVIPTLSLAAVMLFLAIGTFAFFIATRKDAAILYLSLICLSLFIYLAGVSNAAGLLVHRAPPLQVVIGCSIWLLHASLIGFGRMVLKWKNDRAIRWTQYACYGYACTILVTEYVDSSLSPRLVPLSNLLTLGLISVGIFVVLRSAIKGHIDAKIICCGLGLLCVISIPDMIMLLGLWNRLSRYLFIQIGQVFLILSFGLVLIRRFAETHRQLGKYSELLTEQVRTLERHNTEIQNLNGELRRQIELRSDRMIELLSRSRSETTASPLQVLTSGEMLTERYRVIRALGKGAMGAVYEVERSSDGLHLAAKLLYAQSQRKAIIRFVREARILAKLSHPNLVAIMDIDISSAGDLFLVMELVQGSTLKDAKSRYADLHFVWSVLHGISIGLQAVHAQGVVHRDLKPANVLLTESKEELTVKIADFGISSLHDAGASSSGVHSAVNKSDTAPAVAAPALQPAVLPSESPDDAEAATLDQPSGGSKTPVDALERAAPTPPQVLETPAEPGGPLTQTGVVLGTPLYRAPELADGSRNAAPASDVFSLGVIAFEMLTGVLPFAVPPVISIWNHQPLVIPQLGPLRPDLPQPVLAVLQRCLGVNPALRPTLDELVSLFANLRKSGAPIEA